MAGRGAVPGKLLGAIAGDGKEHHCPYSGRGPLRFLLRAGKSECRAKPCHIDLDGLGALAGERQDQ